MALEKNIYALTGSSLPAGLCFGLVSDLHGGEPRQVLEMLRQEKPNYILMAGDIFEALDGKSGEGYGNGMLLLSEAARIAPVIYSTGNHEDGATRSWCMMWRRTLAERHYNGECIGHIEKSGALMVCDGYIIRDGIAFGGIGTGLIFKGREPRLGWLSEFCRLECPKVLLCHHPEYYRRYLKDMPIDLIVSGHAHGGQWRFFGRGVFAPGQGLFPKYTKGIYDNKLVVSTGLKTGTIPRFFNSPEVVFIKT